MKVKENTIFFFLSNTFFSVFSIDARGNEAREK